MQHINKFLISLITQKLHLFCKKIFIKILLQHLICITKNLYKKYINTMTQTNKM